MIRDNSNSEKEFCDDESLIKRAQSGNKAAFDILILRYKDKIFNLCFRFLGDHAEADDLAQETFIKIYLSIKFFRYESSFSTWIYRITVNICKNRLNSLSYRFKKMTKSLYQERETEKGSLTNDVADNSLSPDCEFEEKKRKIFIQKAISALSEDQKQVIILRDIEGLSYEEIVEITGYNIGTVKSRLSRARLNLKERLKGLI